MSNVGRTPPRPPIAVATVTTAHAALPQQQAPSGPTPQHGVAPHHGAHHVAHPHATHAHAGHAPHAPSHAPKPRRPPKPRKGRRRNSSGEVSDEDELDIGGDEAHQLGAAAVTFDSEHQDSGDNHQHGDGDAKREDRTLRARFDDAAAPAAAAALRRRATDTAFATNRYHRGLCDTLVGTDCRPDMAARVAQLDLDLLRATLEVTRIDQGGLARARANLLAHAPPVPTAADRPSPDSAAGRANCIAVMKELQLQLRRSADSRRQSIALLEVRQRARTA